MLDTYKQICDTVTPYFCFGKKVEPSILETELLAIVKHTKPFKDSQFYNMIEEISYSVRNDDMNPKKLHKICQEITF